MAADQPPGEAVSREATRRLFFALWPDAGMREAMVQATRKAARASGGRPVPAENLHVTLAFLGSVAERRLPELGELARGEGESAGPALELVFDHLEHWRPAQVLCAAAAEPPTAVAALARKLQGLLIGRGFAPDLESSWSVAVDMTKQFRPHVTLARKVYRPPRVMEIDPVTWSLADFVLVDSKTLPEGSVYTVLERFPLRH